MRAVSVKIGQSFQNNSIHRQQNGGFTLVEVLAAVVLLSIAMLAILTANSASRSTQLRAVEMAAGRNVADSIVAQIRATPFDSCRAKSFPTQDSSLPAGNKISVSITGYPTASENNLLKAVIKVSWPEANGTRALQYNTLIARK